MEKDNLLASIKIGMIGELDSVHLYTQAATHSAGEVRKFFQNRVEEEKRHYNFLLQYYKEIAGSNEVSKITEAFMKEEQAPSPIITEEFVRRIGENQILFSAISTALLLEKNAIDFYDKCAEEMTVAELREFYSFIALWETKHYEELLTIQKEAEQYFWNENHFEPF